MKKATYAALLALPALSLLSSCDPLLNMASYAGGYSTGYNQYPQAVQYPQTMQYAQPGMMPPAYRIGGIWAGTCYNETMHMSGTLRMTLAPNGNQVNGSLMVGGGNLYGSGSLTGTASGDTITFYGPPGNPRTHTRIVWTGRVSQGTMVGKYRVEPRPGFQPQVGSFRLTQLR